MSNFMAALLSDDSPVRDLIVMVWSERTKLNPLTGRVMNNPPYGGANPGGIVSLAESTAAAGVWICPTLVV